MGNVNNLEAAPVCVPQALGWFSSLIQSENSSQSANQRRVHSYPIRDEYIINQSENSFKLTNQRTVHSQPIRKEFIVNQSESSL